MAYISGIASSIYDVIEQMDSLLLSVGWSRVVTKNYTWGGVSRLGYAIWVGRGDGTDNVYIQARVRAGQGKDMLIDSMTGYDSHLEYFEQPGSIQQSLKSYGYDDSDNPVEVAQPMFTVTEDERFAYWFFADTYRIIGICRMSIVYESFYMGFLNPISSERQYPYPMYIAGNTYYGGGSWSPSTQTGSFVFPKNNQGMLRRADGVWRAFNADKPNPSPDSVGTLFPYNAHNTSLVPNYHDTATVDQDNFLIIPVMLQTTNPTDINGLLRDVYWISGTRDVASEQILTFNSKQYIVFDTKSDRGSNTYFCIKMV